MGSFPPLFNILNLDDKDIYTFDMNDRGHRCLHKFNDYGSLSGTSIAVSNNSQFIATGYVLNMFLYEI